MLNKDRLNKLLFLEWAAGPLKKYFNYDAKGAEVFLPVDPAFLIQEIQEGSIPEELPLSEFILGMATVIALDPDFHMAGIYRQLLLTHAETEGVLKSRAAAYAKADRLEDAYLLIKAWYELDGEEEAENQLLVLGEELALKNEDFMDEVLSLSDLAKESGNPTGHLIAASLKRKLGKEAEALGDLEAYLAMGGEATEEISQLKEALDRNTKAEAAYEQIYEEPAKALKTLLDLLPREGDNPRLIYAIALAYRLLGNHEKAIFYLEEALALDPTYMDVNHEMGINYAMINDFKTAVTYFRRVFQATGAFEPMTNLIVALFRAGESQEAKELFNKARIIKPEDEILQEIQRIYFPE